MKSTRGNEKATCSTEKERDAKSKEAREYTAATEIAIFNAEWGCSMASYEEARVMRDALTQPFVLKLEPDAR